MIFRVPFLVVLLATGLGSVEPAAAQARWSYDDLDRVLGRHVSAEGFVDYASLREDRAALDRFVERLGRTSPDSHPEIFPEEADRLAYWMNAYNALMLKRVVDAWPIDSVREIKPGYGVFWMERHTLGGERRTLRGLENKIIRKRFGDPRIHFAINCASAGCPALPRRAWRPESLEADLESAARRFVDSPDKVRIDREAGTIHLSKIFDWFKDDFTGWLRREELDPDGGIVDYVSRYLDEQDLAGLDVDELRVEWIEYDWSVNAVR